MKTVFLAVLSALAFATTASAQVSYSTFQAKPGYEEKLTGTVSGVDTYGIFGAAGANLTGKTFSEIFFINTAVSGSTLSTTSAGQSIYGYGSKDPVTVEISLNNGPWLYFGSGSAGYYGSAAISNPTQVAPGYTEAEVDSASRNNTTTTFKFEFASSGDNRFGQNEVLKNPVGSNTVTVSVNGSDCDPEETLKFNTAVYSAPEPSTWILMLGGVAFLGAALKVRGRQSGALLSV